MKKRAQQGFTLIELMIVVAIIGILAAVAIPMFWEATGKAKKTEAIVQLEKIKKKAIESYTTNATFPPLPAALTPGQSCCDQNIGGKKKCAAVDADWDKPEWRALEFSLNENFFFQYKYEPTGNGAAFKATAVGDTDCDGTTVTFTLDGTNVSGTPKISLNEPTNSD
jgi:prepilin-type N-terminal cleavage/methylation domain-containing protein